ncbi:MAG TPA: aconitate hydratase [Thermoanaerobaculia bacterium]|nr:aconitate hydratase [Thermoanaerobaculia bacterium]
MAHSLLDTLQDLDLGGGRRGTFYSLPRLEEQGVGKISRLPVSIRIVLESVLRNYDGTKIREQDVRMLANWKAKAERTEEVPFVVARILLQDFTGVPLLVDLAAMRSAASRFDADPRIIEPLVPVDLVVDHSVQVDFFGTPDAMEKNLEIEFRRNRERYEFLKWGEQAFDGFRVVPPGIGIVHQVNLEYLAKGVLEKDGIVYPDTLVGTDSHTTMINGLGVVGWGVGGIEAEAGMLGQPIYILTPDVIGVHMTGRLRDGVTATDLALHITQMLRKEGVVGKFVEYIGEGAASLSLADRATISNMSPEYGATMGFFPVDEESARYLASTGRTEAQVDAFRSYFKAQGMFGMPGRDQCDYTRILDLDLAGVRTSVSGPKRPQDRINLEELKTQFHDLLTRPFNDGGYGLTEEEIRRRPDTVIGGNGQGRVTAGGGEQDPATAPVDAEQRDTSITSETEMMNNRPTPDRVPLASASRSVATMHHGDVVIAAITSCTNTSNPSVMIAAGLLAKKANEKGLTVGPVVKTSLAPGSRVVTDYLTRSGLQPELDRIGFNLVGYGCTTCIGNSGPLPREIEQAVVDNDLVVASVLSGNRNFEARIHQSVKANFLMSPPLVVAFALAGRIDVDLSSEPLQRTASGEEVYLRDLWPSMDEIREVMHATMDPETFRRLYRDFADQNPMWKEIPSSVGKLYPWKESSTYIQEPPFFDRFTMNPKPVHDIAAARPLAIFGDSVTTDHISPAGAIQVDSPAGRYLIEQGVSKQDFNSYGSRRGNDRVMTRGTFANVRIKNRMVPGVEGGVTVLQPAGERMSIYDAAMKYREAMVPLVVLAGKEYGTGSSRDWAAKGTLLLGVRVVIAESFERIHRSNLIGMGVLPCQFLEGTTVESLGLDGSETFDLLGIQDRLAPQQKVRLLIHRGKGRSEELEVQVRLDTPIEVDYYRHGGILPYVLRQLISAS